MDRAFTIAPNVRCSIQGITFINGIADRGGAILIHDNSSLEMSNCIFRYSIRYIIPLYILVHLSLQLLTNPPISSWLPFSIRNNTVLNKNGEGGGAIYLSSHSEYFAKTTQFVGNSVQLRGGAIFASSESLLTLQVPALNIII